jgi:predicted Ser/Thr protein kinase
MDITEVRRRFAAYASGSLSEAELRNGIRTALVEEPVLSTAYIALTEAYRRANVIDADLQSSIVADISELTGPAHTGSSRLSTAWGRSTTAGARRASPDDLASWVMPADGPAVGGADDRFSLEMEGSSEEARDGDRPATDASGATLVTGPPTGANWDSPDGLAQSATPLAPGAVLNNHYELLEELGRGGMGVVYKALDRRAAELNDKHCYVAIKVLNEDFKRHPLAVRSLQREARKAQKLAHPNILTVFTFDRDGGNAFMVMELLSGHSLDQLVRAEGKGGLPLHRVSQIVKSLGAALSYAHAQGIIHSDFKPSNAFLTDDGIVMVLDFGIARAAPATAGRGDYTVFDAGQLGAVCPAYATVEMLSGEHHPDVRDDVYALAAVTYELLTGRHPFNRIDAQKAREAGLEPQPVRGISRAQWQALKRGLAFERKARTPSIDELVAPFVGRRSRGVARWVVAATLFAVAIGLGLFAWSEWASGGGPAHGRIAELGGTLRTMLGTQMQGLVTAGRVEYAEHRLAKLNPAAAGYVDEALARRDDLRTLATLAPASPTLARVRSTLAEAVFRRTAQYLGEDDIAGAQQLLHDANGVLPEQDLIAVRETVAAAERAVEQRRTARQAPAQAAPTATPQQASAPAGGAAAAPAAPVSGNGAELAGAKNELSALISRPEASERWATSVHELMQKLEPLVPADDPAMATARQIAVGTFVIAAVSAHEAKQYTAATGLLDTARGFDPQSPQVTQEAAAIERDRSTFESGTAEKAQRATVPREVPHELVDGYVRTAKTQLAAGDVDSALQTLATARKRFGRDQQLKDLEVRYVRIADVYDRLGTAVSLNASEQRTTLEELRISEGDDYPVTEQMLARTLGNRIADERAADRPTVAASLLKAGRQIFPGDVSLLEQGKAGVLPAPPPAAAEQPDAATGKAAAVTPEKSAAALETTATPEQAAAPAERGRDAPENPGATAEHEATAPTGEAMAAKAGATPEPSVRAPEQTTSNPEKPAAPAEIAATPESSAAAPTPTGPAPETSTATPVQPAATPDDPNSPH